MSSHKKQILLITSTNLASNPRCLKELRLLCDLGIKVTVVAFNLHNWTTDKERELNNLFNNKVDFFYLEATRKEFVPWIISTMMESFSRAFSNFLSWSQYWEAMAISKRSWILLKWSKRWKGNADLIIAHNPPSFYVASKLAERLEIDFALDIEDYHPGESNSYVECKSVKLLMQKLIPKAIYVSYASALIKKWSEKLIQKATPNNGILVNNFFYSCDFEMSERNLSFENKLKIVWFSQVVDYKRGLENVLPVLDLFNDKVCLTLIGNMKQEFYNLEIKDRNYINCIPALSQKELNMQLSSFDVGIAIEPGRDLNNKLALSNKILSYFQAGLYIIASSTEGQKLFMDQYPLHGICTSWDFSSFKDSISVVLDKKSEIIEMKRDRYMNASTQCWENESILLTEKWAKLLGINIYTK